MGDGVSRTHRQSDVAKGGVVLSVWQGKNVLVTGASSGIGEALSIQLARAGARVGLLARREARIKALAERIEGGGGSAVPLVGDVSRRDDVHWAVEHFVRQSGPIDVLIANAGRSVQGEDETNGRLVADVYGVNFFGAVYTFEAVLPAMRSRGEGQIAVVSSGTALLPKLAASPTYASSKEAVGRYFEGLGRELSDEGVIVTVIYPGFVRTEMTSGHQWMPFAVDADHAARVILRAIEQGRRRFLFPKRVFWLGRLVQLIPTRYQVKGRKRYAGKPQNR